MKKNEAINIAKNKKSTTDQLMCLLGTGIEVDRLLAKHSNVTAQILVQLSKSIDPAVLRKVVGNPATPKDILVSLGSTFPGTLLKNQALSSILLEDKKFPSMFGKATLLKLLGHKDCPEQFGEWVLKYGTAQQQAAYLFRSARFEATMRKFVKSKHFQIVGALIGTVDCIYVDWAVRLGWPLVAAAKPGASELPNAARAQIDAWLKEKATEAADMWTKLVPKSGCAETVQGELVRSIGRIQSEYYRNAMMNWDDGSFEKMAQFIEEKLKSDRSFSPFTKRYVEALVAQVRESSRTGTEIAKGEKPRSAAFGGNIMLVSDVETAHERIKSLIVLWCEKHPDPIPNPEYIPQRQEVEYSRTPDQYVTFLAPCPNCGGIVRETEKRYQCTGASGDGEGCGFGFGWRLSGRVFNSSEVELLLKNKAIGPLKGFFSKASNLAFDSFIFLKFNPDTNQYTLEFDYDGSARVAQMLSVAPTSLVLHDSLGTCPKCGARVFESGESYVCESAVSICHGVNSACDFKLRKTHLGQKIDRKQMLKLLLTGSTDLLNGFVSERSNRSFEAKLFWNSTRGRFDFWFRVDGDLKTAKLRKK